MAMRHIVRLILVSVGSALASKVILPEEKDLKQDQTCKNCYITHPPCLVSNEGIGGTTSTIHPILDIAMRHNMKYICQSTDFDTGDSSHHTGNLGYLFGCDFRGAKVTASGLACASISDLPPSTSLKLDVRLSNAGQFWMGDLGMRTLGDEDAKILDNTWYNVVSWQVKESKLYHKGDFVWEQDCPILARDGMVTPYTRMEAYRQSYKWFRHQWHLIRRSDPNRQVSKCQDPSKPNSIVVHIRLGDYTYTVGIDKYVEALDAIFAGEVKGAHFTQESSFITVLVETSADDTKMEVFRKYKNLKVLSGIPETERDDSTERVIRDLDCMSMSDLLLVSNGGFSGLGSAIQKDGGKTFVMDAVADKGRFDNPNSNTSPNRVWLVSGKNFRKRVRLVDTAVPSVQVFGEEVVKMDA